MNQLVSQAREERGEAKGMKNVELSIHIRVCRTIYLLRHNKI